MDLESTVALALLPRISRCRAAAVFKDLRLSQPDITLEEVVEACDPAGDVEARGSEARAHAAALLRRARASGIDTVCWSDERYPPLLRAIADPPAVLWVRGDASALARPAVAIVGSRAATPYALEVAARLGGELASRGLVVVSGLARGADGAAHRGCLDADGHTIAVLGSGPDVIYPPEHDALAERIARSGAVVSEVGPGAKPLQENFPLRNRLISGISLAVVVVEASEKSGSLITARYALEQGRDVMAVPGSVLGGRNRGSHALLKDGAKVVETADDIVEELGWTGGVDTRQKISLNPLKSDPLLTRLSPGETYDLDEMSATVGIAGSKLLPRLTDWETQGRITRLPGGRYALSAGQR